MTIRETSLSATPLYLTVTECAALLRVDHKTVRAAINDGRIAVVRIGRTIRISRRVLESLERQATPPSGSPHGS